MVRFYTEPFVSDCKKASGIIWSVNGGNFHTLITLNSVLVQPCSVLPTLDHCLLPDSVSTVHVLIHASEKTSLIHNKINEGWIPFGGFSFRAQVFCMLTPWAKQLLMLLWRMCSPVVCVRTGYICMYYRYHCSHHSIISCSNCPYILGLQRCTVHCCMSFQKGRVPNSVLTFHIIAQTKLKW